MAEARTSGDVLLNDNDQINESLKNLSLNGVKKKRNPKKRNAKSTGHRTPGDSPMEASKPVKPKNLSTSKIPRPLSRSDPSGSSWTLKYHVDPCPQHSSSSNTSQSSFNHRPFSTPKNKVRRASDTQSDQGYKMSSALRVHASSTKSSWPDSSNGPTQSLHGNCSYHSGGASSSNSRSRKNKNGNSRLKNDKYEMYMPLCEVQQGLKKGELIEGILRVNPRNYRDSYISAPDGLTDIYIGGLHDRNRALNGDLVAIKLHPPSKWKILKEKIEVEESCDKKVAASEEIPMLESSPLPAHDSNPENDSSDEEDEEEAEYDNEGEESIQQPALDTSSTQETEQSTEIRDKDIDVGWSDTKDESVDDPNHEQSTSESPLVGAINNGCGWDAGSDDDFNRGPDMLEILGISSLQEQILKFSRPNKVRKEKVDSSLNNVELTKAPVPTSDIHTDSSNLHQTSEQGDVPIDHWATAANNEHDSILISSMDLLDLRNSLSFPQSNGCGRLEEEEEEEEDDEPEEMLLINESNLVLPEDLSSDYSSSPSVRSFHSCDGDEYALFDIEQDLENNNELNFTDFEPADFDMMGDEDIDTNDDIYTAPSIDDLLEDFTISVLNNRLENFIPPSDDFDATPRVVEIFDDIDASFVDLDISPNVSTEPRGVEIFEDLANGDDVNNTLDISIDNANAVPSMAEGDDNLARKKRKRRKNNKRASSNLKIVDEAPKEAEEGALSKMTVEEILKNRPDSEKFIQRTGSVICIIERKGSSIASGHIKLLPDKNSKHAMFVPKDHRFPHMFIPIKDCPRDFFHRPNDYKDSLFLARLQEWKDDDTYAKGCLIKLLGKDGDIDAETEAILTENDVHHHNAEFEEKHFKNLPLSEAGWKVPPEELKSRKDFRNICIFTIDPSTARDLDDALSCEMLKNGNYRIGVHIADVTYFVKENTDLDTEARNRATSVYLVQKVVPMLPPILCEKLCSLNPNEDKLTYSVVWEMTPNGEVVGQMKDGVLEEAWFGRSIIRSCAKLSYEHAQDIIDHPDKEFTPEELPEIHGKFTVKHIKRCVLHLHNLALNMRKRRFDEGALRLDQIKLKFDVDMTDNTPFGFSVFKQMDSHRLVEEYMLLANMAVANKIHQSFPRQSLLRKHPPPQIFLMTAVMEQCHALGIPIRTRTSKELQDSLTACLIEGADDQENMFRLQVLTQMLSKPMQCALYFCSGLAKKITDYHHYALNVKLYTHFTSPIRRYPDILVHRLLSAALGYSEAPDLKGMELEKIAQHCNEKKYNSKKVYEQSCELYLNVFLRKLGRFEDKGMVIAVLDRAFDVMVLKLGIVKRVYCDKLQDINNYRVDRDKSLNRIIIQWKNGNEQTITIFSLVKVILTPVPDDPLKLDAVITYMPRT